MSLSQWQWIIFCHVATALWQVFCDLVALALLVGGRSFPVFDFGKMFRHLALGAINKKVFLAF